jgi:predicted  nucleic acid-binding Zn-ribbon protein
MPEAPRIDELLSRAVAEQVAEQRGQREAFEDISRRLERLEGALGQGVAELSGSDEAAGKHLEAIEGALDERRGEIASLATELAALREETTRLVEAMGQTVSERLDAETDSVEDLRGRLDSIDAHLEANLGRLGDDLTGDLRQQLVSLEHGLSQRLTRLEGALSAEDMEMKRLSALEQRLGQRLSRLEEALATGEVEKQLAALEQGLGQRMSRLESAVRGGETDWRLVALEMSMAQRLARLETALRPGDTERRLASLEEAVGQSLAELRTSVNRLQDVTVAGLDDLREASLAAEAGILERIVAESQVVGARFEAVRPVVDVVVQTHPELALAAAELRRLAATNPVVPTEVEADEADWSEAEADPFPQDEDTGDTEIFLPPEETPIPERRMRSLLPRRYER